MDSINSFLKATVVGGLPQYRIVKSLAEGLTQLESGGDMHPVLMQGANLATSAAN